MKEKHGEGNRERMITKREKLQYAYVFLADALALAISVALVLLLFGQALKILLPYDFSDWVQTLTLLAIAFIVSFLSFNQNENIVSRRLGQEIKLSIKFNFLMTALYAVLMLVTKARMVESRYFAIGVPLFNLVMMPLLHTGLKRMLSRAEHRWGIESFVGIITTEPHAEAMIRDLQSDWSRRIVGLALIEASGEELGREVAGIRVEANYSNFMDWLRRSALDEVFVDIPMDSGESFLPYLEEMESMGLTVHFRLPILDRIEQVCCGETQAARLGRTLGRCAGGNIMTIGTLELQLRDQVLKRMMDISGALVGCLISLPIIAIVAIPLKIESPGPLIFKQKRVGLNGRIFYIHKLRSMYTDAEERKKELMAKNEMNGLMFKMQDDPRITKVGKFIRKTSIDELPQFFDVLCGNMSLVGTRPPTVDEYNQYDSHHKRRLSMKPGITGLWQVSGRSSIQNFEDVVALDVQYIDHWSLWGDVKLLFKTVAVVFTGRGAE